MSEGRTRDTRTIFDVLGIDVLAHTDICLARAMQTGRTFCGKDRCVPERGLCRCGAEDEPFGDDAVCQLPAGHEGHHAAELGSTTVVWPQSRLPTNQPTRRHRTHK